MTSRPTYFTHTAQPIVGRPSRKRKSQQTLCLCIDLYVGTYIDDIRGDEV